MAITDPVLLDITDTVDLCQDLDGASALATELRKAAEDGRLGFALHGLSAAEATGLVGVLQRMRGEDA